MQSNFDVVVVGAGPIGITTACTLKAIHNHLNICVIDKRPEPVRNHGLRINGDSVDKIQTLLESTLNSNSSYADPEGIQGLHQIFEGWRDNFVRTSHIENELAKTAHQMGITVLRDKGCTITEENFASLCSPEGQAAANVSSQLQQIFENAPVVIGADGAHSVVRKVVMKNKFSHEEILRHLVELKYQTSGQMQARGYTEASTGAVKHKMLSFETTSNDQSKPAKPVTWHLFVGEPTYNSLRIEDKEGRLKGVFGNSWTLNELKQLATTDKNVKRIYIQMINYLRTVTLRQGSCQNEQISTLSMNVYRSKHSVKEYYGKYVLLVGDAESGLVLERGFNKGLKGAAICAHAVSSFFSAQMTNDEMPLPFKSYEEEMRALFENERKWAKLKNTALKVVEAPLYSSMVAKESTIEAIDTSSNFIKGSLANSKVSCSSLSSKGDAEAESDSEPTSSGCTLL